MKHIRMTHSLSALLTDRNKHEVGNSLRECLRLLSLSYLLLVLTQYLVKSAIVTTLLFYGLFVPFLALLLSFVAVRKHAADLLGSADIAGIVGLLTFFAVHAVFLGGLNLESLRNVVNAIAVEGFLVATFFLFTLSSRESIENFFRILSLAAGIGALISLALFFAHNPASIYDNSRLSPIGRAGNPVLGALLYGAAGVVTLYCLKTAKGSGWKVIFTAVLILICGLVWLTQSRAPLLIYMLCMVAGIVLFSSNRLRAAFFLVTGSALTASFATANPALNRYVSGYLAQCMARGANERFALWSETIDKIAAHPWTGYGFRARLESQSAALTAYSPHNLYLATAFYAGIPAAAVFIYLLLRCAARAANLARSSDPLSILAALLLMLGLLSGVTDQAQIVKSPGPLWVVFWLPVALVFSLHERVRSRIKPASERVHYDLIDTPAYPT